MASHKDKKKYEKMSDEKPFKGSFLALEVASIGFSLITRSHLSPFYCS